ncbi:hypothetical protein L873DRAFT_1793682 [Choiromyces venosus 120613-1]|uniref:Uncharacterized protein n=1 Tax=Choiromyces venosus 120613-1 TaxID=1336337 RepID=A0A3N4J5F7_9PEZI|nr:hypothetical protein L873DRAFT_1793682 [Choiromyces venosus 120613-1]
MEMVLTGKVLLTLKTDITTPSHLLMPLRYVLDSSRCQHSNGGSHVFLASVPAELQAAIEMVFTGKFLPILKTDISTPSHSLVPARHGLDSPQYLLSNGASHVLLASVSAELQAAIVMVFTGEFLLTLKTDIPIPRHSLTPVRHISESPRCQPSNGASHNLLASVSGKL